jgi:MFS transporter, MHS family, proline/betaine transporter
VDELSLFQAVRETFSARFRVWHRTCSYANWPRPAVVAGRITNRVVTATRENGLAKNLEQEKSMTAYEKTSLSKATKMAMISQFLGFMLDAYDMALVLIMAPILTKLFAPPSGSAAWQYLSIVILYSITMAARPVGSAIFGHYADKIGRRLLLVVTIAGVGFMSVLSAFLPTQATAGVWAYVIFSVLRFVLGCFFGGEYAVGHTFAIEHAPKRLRGAIGGFIQSGFPAGYVLASLVFAAFSWFLGQQGMLDYGWRIVMATGVMPVFLALYIRKNLPESPEFERAKATGQIGKAPFLSLFKPPALWSFIQVFFFMTGLFLTDYAVYGFLPKILSGEGRFDTSTYALIYGFALFCAFIGYNVYGWLSDRVGRRKLTLYYSVFLVALGVPTFYVLHQGAVAKSIGLALAGSIMAAMLKLAWGIIPAYLSERFPTKQRSVGVGFGYSSGALIGGAGISLFVWWAHHIPFIQAIEGDDLWLSPAVILTVGAAMTFISLFYSPETNDLELSQVETSDFEDEVDAKAA